MAETYRREVPQGTKLVAGIDVERVAETNALKVVEAG
jgi:hypothetical protein